jgi:hypothetical protein
MVTSNDNASSPTLPAINLSSTPADPSAVKTGLAQMLEGGVIMDVVNAEQGHPG